MPNKKRLFASRSCLRPPWDCATGAYKGRAAAGQQPPVGLQPRQDDQVDEGVDKQADRECIRTDPDGPLSEALTGCNQE